MRAFLSVQSQIGLDEDTTSLSTESIQWLRFRLNDTPHPTFQLVNLLRRHIDEKLFDELEYYTLLNAVENVSESKEFSKLYTMLANFELQNEDKYEQFETVILPQLVEKVETGVLSAEKVAFALIARTDDLLRQFLQRYAQSEQHVSTNLKRFLFTALVERRKNGIYEITRHNVLAQQFVDPKLREYLSALRLCNVANEMYGDKVTIEAFLHRIDEAFVQYQGNNQLLKVRMTFLGIQIIHLKMF